MQLDVESRLLDDANTRLKEAIDESDMVGMKIANEMVSSAKENFQTATVHHHMQAQE